jgi:hypothetical protein
MRGAASCPRRTPQGRVSGLGAVADAVEPTLTIIRTVTTSGITTVMTSGLTGRGRGQPTEITTVTPTVIVEPGTHPLPPARSGVRDLAYLGANPVFVTSPDQAEITIQRPVHLPREPVGQTLYETSPRVTAGSVQCQPCRSHSRRAASSASISETRGINPIADESTAVAHGRFAPPRDDSLDRAAVRHGRAGYPRPRDRCGSGPGGGQGERRSGSERPGRS